MKAPKWTRRYHVEAVVERLEVRDFREAAERIAKAHAVTLEALLDVRRGPKGDHPAPKARAAFVSHLRDQEGQSVTTIARLLGVDRWTVIRDLGAGSVPLRDDMGGPKAVSMVEEPRPVGPEKQDLFVHCVTPLEVD